MIPGSGRFLRREWLPIPVLLPGNPMDRGAKQATVHGACGFGRDFILTRIQSGINIF